MRLPFRFNLALGLLLVSLVILGAVFAPLLTSYDPALDADLMSSELPPSAEHWFGTDSQGRDVFSRVLHGARVSLTVGIVAQLINSTIGTALGVSAGYWLSLIHI